MTEGAALAEAVRQGLRRLAKTVTIVTCRHEGLRYAMPATAVTEVSLDPPSMLVCVNRVASLHAPLSAGADFCINILHRAQIDVADHCSAAKGENRFESGRWDMIAGVPCLRDAQANFICRNAEAGGFGTHAIFVGRVIDVLIHDEIDPLVYADGRYTRISGSSPA